MPPDKAAEARAVARDGVTFNWLSHPPPDKVYRNTPTVSRHMAICEERRRYYQDLGVLESLSERPPNVAPLHVVIKPPRKPRMVLDAGRNLNDYVRSLPLSYPTIYDAVRNSHRGCWYGKMDLKDCFLSFPVNPAFHRWLAFELNGAYYRFTRMIFGLKDAPRINELMLSVVSHYLRARDVNHIRYVDDILIIGTSAEEVRRSMQCIRDTLPLFGLRNNPAKEEGPVQCLEFLGISIDSVSCTLFCPPSRIQELRGLFQHFRSKRSCSLKALQSLVGKLTFAAQVLPGAKPFFSRLLDLLRAHHGHRWVQLNKAFRADCSLWLRMLPLWNHSYPWSTYRQAPHITLAADACFQGYGFLVESADPSICRALPTHLRPAQGHACFYAAEDVPTTTNGAIQWGELLALVHGVAAIAPYIPGCNLQLYSDNIADVAIIRRQRTSCPALSSLLRTLYGLAAVYGFNIHIQHRPGDINILADHLSRPTLHKHLSHSPFPNLTHIHFSHSQCLHPLLAQTPFLAKVNLHQPLNWRTC